MLRWHEELGMSGDDDRVGPGGIPAGGIYESGSSSAAMTSARW
jgi:hypothetical protein